MRLRFFGGFDVRDDVGAVIEVPGARQRALLFRLALDAGTTVTYRALAEDVWGLDVPEDPRAALHSLVSRLRRSLPADAVSATPGGYRLEADRADVDLVAFADLVAAARGDADPSAARRALALWCGEAWTPDGFDWVVRDLLEDRAHAERIAAAAPSVAEPPRPPATSARPETAARSATRAMLADPAPGASPEPHAPGAPAIPASLTPLIGREDELALIEAQLREARLVTLLGPGGAGKTTLALETARGHAPAVFVELAPADASGVWDAVATALGRSIRLAENTPASLQTSRERALGTLAGRPLLLVLDNAEHVVAQAADVAEQALRVAPALRLLVTSREPLAVPGEAFVAVGSLPEPDAMTLLSARIRAARGTPPDETEIEAVARICRRLDGLPLALELAGAKARVLSVAEIEAGLADRFALLDRGPRTAQPRHQTLRAVIDWSWSLLAQVEREALLMLAVFPDGVAAADLPAVAAEFELPPRAVDDLVDRSLVQRSRGRYRLLETVREYGLDELRRDGGLERARARQAAVMADLALAQDALLRTPDAHRAIAWFDADQENLAAATRWSAGRGDIAVRLVRAQVWGWQLRERIDLLRSALARTGEAAAGLRTEADVVVAGMAMLMQMMLDPSTERLSDASIRSLADAAAHYDSEIAAVLPVLLRAALRARAQRRGGEPWSSHLRLDEGEIAHGPEWSRAFVAVMNAAAAQNNGDIERLGEASGRGLDMFLRVGDAWGVSFASQMRSEWLMLQGRLEESLRVADDSTRALEGLTPVADQLQQEGLGVALLLRLGRHAEARGRVAEMLRRADADGSERAIAQAETTAASLEIVLGNGEAALRALDRTISLETQHELAGFPAQVIAWQESKRALALLLVGDPDAAAEALRRAVPIAVGTGDQPVMSEVAIAFARWFLAAGRLGDAAAALAEADRLRGLPDLSEPVAAPVRAALRSADPDVAASGPADLGELAARL
ncbi:AAA family ATPase [Microbacterium sp. SORGH_AS_0888]|uniref:AAA family ATPase n=1 Tax=Microbacterium sp. SORGH_AS_0888 TaxID=3041791 RepID=UPI0027880422|nr:AAA family ATPase [Microbacterium sp. SORGH_AS_0888]MDQ1129597.1 putative ATPase [Microbacterium sp. SORGH_AS_0888]